MINWRTYEPEGPIKGPEAFKELYKLGRIQPSCQVIEVLKPFEAYHDNYSVTLEGKLENTVSGKVFEPEEILSEDKAKDGWNVVNFLFPAQDSLN